MASKQLLILAAVALCTVMCRPAETDESPLKQPITTGTSQKGSLSDPEITDEVGMKNRMYQYALGPPQGFIPVYFMMPPPPNPGGNKQRMRRPYYQKERDPQQNPPMENPDPNVDLEQNQKSEEDRTSIANPEPSTVEFPAGDSIESSRPMDQDQPERSAKDLEQLQTFSSLVQPPRAIPARTKRTPQRVRSYLDVDDYGRGGGYGGGYGGYGGHGGYGGYGGYGGGYHGYNPYRGGYDDEVIDIDIQI